MTFRQEEPSGFARLVPCKRDVESINDLVEEARALWKAEAPDSKVGKIAAGWGSVGVLFGNAGARERLAKTQATSLGLSLGARLLGLGELGNVAADLGTQLLSLKYSRDDETEADLVGLELGARAGYNPQASVSLWRKMMAANGRGGPGFLSTHPSGPNRIQELQDNLPRVRQLYEQARG